VRAVSLASLAGSITIQTERDSRWTFLFTESVLLSPKTKSSLVCERGSESGLLERLYELNSFDVAKFTMRGAVSAVKPLQVKLSIRTVEARPALLNASKGGSRGGRQSGVFGYHSRDKTLSGKEQSTVQSYSRS
jgi:hypothetical protein